MRVIHWHYRRIYLDNGRYTPMLRYSRNWWAWFLRGIISIFFGIYSFVEPHITLVLLVLAFGIYALVDGAVHLLASFFRANHFRIWHVLEGLLGILAGTFTFFWPLSTTSVLLALVAIWAVLSGIVRIVHWTGLRQLYFQESTLLFSGILSILFGVVFLAAPIVEMLTISMSIGIYSFVLGILYVRLGLWLRTHHPTLFAAAGSL